jgi:pimeloyl-ACP methyl ester carboxylesterase
LRAAAVFLLLCCASAAFADPVLDRVESAVSKGRRLDVTIESTLAAPGEVAVTGDVNGVLVDLRRRLDAGHHTVTLHVDAKKLGLRKLASALEFTLQAVARETGGLETAQDVAATIPVPCVVLPSFGNETTPGSFAAFATAIDVAAGGIYELSGRHPSLLVHEYASRTQSLATLGRKVGAAVKKAVRGTVFQTVDLVGYSYGGLVARSYLAQAGGARVRNCVFLATPNEGTPLAYVAVGLSDKGQLDDFLGANAEFAALAQQLLTGDAKASLRNVYPTYEWAFAPNPFTNELAPVPTAYLDEVLGPSATPLEALDAAAPPANVAFHAFYYSSTGTSLGTLDVIDVSSFAGGGQVDPTTLATGSGDGLVPVHSVTMDEYPAWRDAIAPNRHDLGAGTHLSMPADVVMIAAVADLLTR